MTMPKIQDDETAELTESLNALARVDRKLTSLALKIAIRPDTQADNLVKNSARKVRLDPIKGRKAE